MIHYAARGGSVVSEHFERLGMGHVEILVKHRSAVISDFLSDYRARRGSKGKVSPRCISAKYPHIKVAIISIGNERGIVMRHRCDLDAMRAAKDSKVGANHAKRIVHHFRIDYGFRDERAGGIGHAIRVDDYRSGPGNARAQWSRGMRMCH